MAYFERKYNKFFQPHDKKNRFLLSKIETITDICVGLNRYGTSECYYLLTQCFAILENQNDRQAYKDAVVYLERIEAEVADLRKQIESIKKYIK